MAQAEIVPIENAFDAERVALIAAQNDAFRTSGNQDRVIKGQIVMTQGVATLAPVVKAILSQRLWTFDAFTSNNDPFGDHSFGCIAFNVSGTDHRVFWKIDLYDTDYEYGSDDAANPEVTRRVLTVMLPCEY